MSQPLQLFLIPPLLRLVEFLCGLSAGQLYLGMGEVGSLPFLPEQGGGVVVVSIVARHIQGELFLEPQGGQGVVPEEGVPTHLPLGEKDQPHGEAGLGVVQLDKKIISFGLGDYVIGEIQVAPGPGLHGVGVLAAGKLCLVQSVGQFLGQAQLYQMVPHRSLFPGQGGGDFPGLSGGQTAAQP